jgi:hypothetical protein
METNAFYREILAQFVEGAQELEAQCYSIKPLHNEILSLADLMEVSSENLQNLLVKGGLGKLGRDKELMSFQPSKYESFRSKFSIEEACETTLQYVKDLKTKQWLVRLGTKYFGDLGVPGTKGRAPRVKNIWALQQDFKDTLSALASQRQAEADHPVPQKEQEEQQSTEGEIEDPHESDLVLLRVQRILLPLLLKEELLHTDLWAPEVDLAAVQAALHSIVTELRQHRDDSLSVILQTVQAPTSPNTKENPTALPMLKAYGLSLDDRRVHENLLRDLYFLNKKHAKSNTLY